MDWGNCVVNGVATLGCISVLYQNFITGILSLVGTLAVILLVIAGTKFITAQGDSKKIESARSMVTYVIIGLVVILFAFLIVNIVADFTGVQCIKNFKIGGCPAN